MAMTDQMPGPRHNNPPDPLIVEASERVDNANRWLTERGDIGKWDGTIADRGNFFLSQVQATWDALDGQRLQEGRDFKKAQETKYSQPLSLLIMAKSKIGALRTAWLKKEEDRLAAEKAKVEEAARVKAAEADAAIKRAAEEAKKKGGDALRAELAAKEAVQAAADAVAAVEAAPVKAQITGTYSARATGLKDHWSATIVDFNAALKHYGGKKNPNRLLIEAAIRECIQGIANKDAVRLKTEDPMIFPPGITFVKTRK